LCAVYGIAFTASSLRSTRDWEGRAISPLKGMATTKKIKIKKKLRSEDDSD